MYQSCTYVEAFKLR